MSEMVASSSKLRQSHRTLPWGVRNSSARWPIPNCGWVWISNRSPSSCRHALTCPPASFSGIVQTCPPRGTNCRSSSQIRQRDGGSEVSGYEVPQVQQIWIGIEQPFITGAGKPRVGDTCCRLKQYSLGSIVKHPDRYENDMFVQWRRSQKPRQAFTTASQLFSESK